MNDRCKEKREGGVCVCVCMSEREAERYYIAYLWEGESLKCFAVVCSQRPRWTCASLESLPHFIFYFFTFIDLCRVFWLCTLLLIIILLCFEVIYSWVLLKFMALTVRHRAGTFYSLLKNILMSWLAKWLLSMRCPLFKMCVHWHPFFFIYQHPQTQWQMKINDIK